MILSDVFTRPSIENDVSELHTNIRNSFYDLFKEVNKIRKANGEGIINENDGTGIIVPPTLKFFMAMPLSFPDISCAPKVALTLDLIDEFMDTDEIPQLEFCSWDLPAISILKTRFASMRDPRIKSILNKESPKIELLESASWACLSATSVLAIKYYMIALQMDNQFFYGAQANTSPVRKATKILWGTDFGGNKHASRHTALCQKIANECDMSPTYVNTVLYLLGERMG